MLPPDLDTEQSIYPDFIAGSLSERSLKFEIPVELGSSRLVTVIDDGSIAGSSDQAPPVKLTTLPPLLLHVFLPPEYPLHQPPRILSLRATHSWLPHINLVQFQLVDTWKAGNTTLYDWIEYLRTGEFFDAVGLLQPNKELIQCVYFAVDVRLIDVGMKGYPIQLPTC
jgi:E3 ubiquitin-protein ligase RNF14